MGYRGYSTCTAVGFRVLRGDRLTPKGLRVSGFEGSDLL